jgi:hypothetical protein
MKIVIALALLFGFLDSQCAQAEESTLRHPHWVIIATIIDRTTGKQFGQTQLGGPELEFANPAQCKSVVRKVHPKYAQEFDRRPDLPEGCAGG